MIDLMEFCRLGEAASRRDEAVQLRRAAQASGDRAALEQALERLSRAEVDFERALGELADA